MAVNSLPPYYPAPNLFDVTPADGTDIPGIPDDGCRIHNRGTSGVVYVDGAVSGTNIKVYIAQGGFAPLLVRRVRSTNLGAGVEIVACW